ncbi:MULTISPECIES: MerR family DNA-binding transcriptional regulator [Mycobacterium]|uniref:HTH merR-type domain-containing protein n=1 Tax=Mycobacterium ostraviense TaxID=2738409 RepID=A0A163YMA5_9MYCO|nr:MULTISPECIES: MerR family DNA-binding transcriptional regulator [Mycobacterium]KZS60575.1 hypothetical protein A4G28_01710 [Mycobacterium ostraviense]UGT93442.1 MerR family DNA-binding transcriptional regulator [Mycobacterium ostraviense]
MRISEVARQAQVNVQTLRYYERRGLLPEPRRTQLTATCDRHPSKPDCPILHDIETAAATTSTATD